MAIDPVCRMQVEEGSAAATSRHEGQTYYFCSPGCKASFDKDPNRYLQPSDVLGRKRPTS